VLLPPPQAVQNKSDKRVDASVEISRAVLRLIITSPLSSNPAQARKFCRNSSAKCCICMGVSDQRQERTNGKVEECRETKKLKNGKVVTRKQRKEIK
jgi:hypothetical protein